MYHKCTTTSEYPFCYSEAVEISLLERWMTSLQVPRLRLSGRSPPAHGYRPSASLSENLSNSLIIIARSCTQAGARRSPAYDLPKTNGEVLQRSPEGVIGRHPPHSARILNRWLRHCQLAACVCVRVSCLRSLMSENTQPAWHNTARLKCTSAATCARPQPRRRTHFGACLH
jgi:hypothetical protein